MTLALRSCPNLSAQPAHRPLKIILAHNSYLHLGGEDSVFASELELLRQHGNVVHPFVRHNAELENVTAVRAAGGTIWSRRTTQDIHRLIGTFQPDIIHCHNTFPLISPSIYWAAAKARIPIVQTLHNFRLLCPQAMFLRDGKICEDCIGVLPLPGIRNACYRSSTAQSCLVSAMLMIHRGIGTWSNKVTRYIALNRFCRDKFISGGLPGERIRIKPNFVDIPAQARQPRSGFLFVGRLSAEKGVDVLLSASREVPAEVRVAGAGPLKERVNAHSDVVALGGLTPEAVREEMVKATALVIPSIWYENLPRTLVEAFACGLPVIASKLGALEELVRDGETGLLFEPGNAHDLAKKMAWALENPNHMAQMGAAARGHYEREFTAAANYQQLSAIYEEAIAETRCLALHGSGK